MTRILGIDPGIEGAWAIVDGAGLVACGELPTVGSGTKRQVSPVLLSSLIERNYPDIAVIEAVGAMPKQGVSSSFRFGEAVGTIKGVLGTRGIPVRMVSPVVWKRAFNLIGGDKEASRARAIERWPNAALLHFSRKKDHGRAEAALIAAWGLHTARLAGEIAA